MIRLAVKAEQNTRCLFLTAPILQKRPEPEYWQGCWVATHALVHCIGSGQDLNIGIPVPRAERIQLAQQVKLTNFQTIGFPEDSCAVKSDKQEEGLSRVKSYREQSNIKSDDRVTVCETGLFSGFPPR